MEQTKKSMNALSHIIGTVIYLAGMIHLFREKKIIATLLGLSLIPMGKDIFIRSTEACNAVIVENQDQKEIESKKNSTKTKMGFDMSA